MPKYKTVTQISTTLKNEDINRLETIKKEHWFNSINKAISLLLDIYFKKSK